MSIFFDFEVGPNGRRFRRAVDGDKYDIEAIINYEDTENIFGKHDIGRLIELSYLSICMINENKEVTGFMALNDHPNIRGLDPSAWEVWIRNMFQKYYLSRNTLFVHFMCCVDSVTDYFVQEALASVFRNDDYLLNIIFVVPIGCPKNWTSRYQAFMKHNIHRFKPKCYKDCDSSMFLYTAMRNDFCPKLRIRRAVEEDSDDIIKIMAKSSPLLHELYGDFYISEIIGRHPDIDRKIIVAEHQDQVVGVMCLNSEINYEMLQRTYELGPLHGLKKATPLEKEKYKRTNTLLETFGDPIMTGQWSPYKDNKKEKTNQNKIKVQPEKKIKKVYSKVNFDGKTTSIIEDYKQNSSEDYSERELHFPSVYIETSQSIINILEDDPFDYDIVNIDNRLLTVPEVFSFEFLLPRSENKGPRSQSNEAKNIMKRRSCLLKEKTKKEIELQKYSGDPNAFMIELFGFRDDIDDRQGFHLLEAAFEVMKDYDYCIIRVPCKGNSFYLLQHFCLIPTKVKMSNEYALYVAHRNSVLSKLRVREAEMTDIPQICQLLRALDSKETLWTVESTILHKNKLKCYVFINSTTLVGVGILEKPEDINYLRVKFNLDAHRIHKYNDKDDFVYGFSNIKVAVAYSVFEPHYRYFAREMMRLSGSSSLIWMTAYRNKWVTHKVNSLAGTMIPLLPRNTETNNTFALQLTKRRKLSNPEIAFSSWFMSKKLTSVAQLNVDTRIVIVGASRTAMAFINSLLFSDACTYLLFTNVTLVSPSGLPYNKRSRSISEMMFQKYHTNSEKFLKNVPYTYYVNIIQGSMVDINRRDKYITLSNKGRCYYDLLFLLFGKQYQHPDYLKSVFEHQQEVRNGKIQYAPCLDLPRVNLKPLVNNTPNNVFFVNTLADANRALGYVKAFTWGDMEYKIIVYGATIHTYCCLATLLEMKIPVENIIFIEPFPDDSPMRARVSLFCNTYIDNAVTEVLNSLKIKVYRSYYFQRWCTDCDNVVSHVEFLSYHRLLKLKCSAFFYYGMEGVNEQAFSAINKSGLVYDGGILIDHQFKTRDPSIYAAGPATRYYRKYYADNKRQKYYDANEVGSVLGNQIRNQLDPLFSIIKKTPKNDERVKNSFTSFLLLSVSKEDDKTSTSIKDQITENFEYVETIPRIPNFEQPHVAYCILPGGLQYLEVRAPGKKVPHQFVQSLNYNGLVMETFKDGYFKLHLTNNLIVDGITCLTLEKYSLENFKHLYGHSVTVLNNVHVRFTAKKIDNFYDFFREPWAYFIYHDQSEELFAMVKELLPKGQREGDTLEEAMRRVQKKLNNKTTECKTRSRIQSNFQTSPHIEAITDYVIEWLSQHDILLPMYLQPWQVTHYDKDVDSHPAFCNSKRTIAKLLYKIF